MEERYSTMLPFSSLIISQGAISALGHQSMPQSRMLTLPLFFQLLAKRIRQVSCKSEQRKYFRENFDYLKNL